MLDFQLAMLLLQFMRVHHTFGGSVALLLFSWLLDFFVCSMLPLRCPLQGGRIHPGHCNATRSLVVAAGRLDDRGPCIRPSVPFVRAWLLCAVVGENRCFVPGLGCVGPTIHKRPKGDRSNFGLHILQGFGIPCLKKILEVLFVTNIVDPAIFDDGNSFGIHPSCADFLLKEIEI